MHVCLTEKLRHNYVASRFNHTLSEILMIITPPSNPLRYVINPFLFFVK